MSQLADYVAAHAVRGACTCGKCVDGVKDPEQHQPEGHTADVVFFKVAAQGEPSVGEFIALVRKEHPNWLDGKECSYIEVGADIGDQGLALMAMGLGELLGVWDVMTPEKLIPEASEAIKRSLAGRGMITIKVLKETQREIITDERKT